MHFSDSLSFNSAIHTKKNYAAGRLLDKVHLILIHTTIQYYEIHEIRNTSVVAVAIVVVIKIIKLNSVKLEYSQTLESLELLVGSKTLIPA